MFLLSMQKMASPLKSHWSTGRAGHGDPAVWLVLWALGLSLGWLLPNHYAPWVAFHFDVWIAYWMALAAGVVFASSKRIVPIHRLAHYFFWVAFIPFFQYFFGLLPYVGQAWRGAAFTLGFVVSMVVGSYWESVNPSQAIDGLFLAIGIAAIASVGLQLYQWLGLYVEALNLWVMGLPHSRPFANFVQPNQLATFLVWSLLAGAWGVLRRKIGLCVAILFACFILFGIALTQSRTAAIALVGVTSMTFFWRKLWVFKGSVWVVIGLLVYFLVCASFLPSLSSAFAFDSGQSMVARSGSDLRLQGYQMFVDAALQSPLWGYGWGQTAVAQLTVAADHPKVGGIFMQAHNLFLDFVLWCGVPIGVAISVALAWWFLDKARRVTTSQNAILIMFVGAVAWHAMLELPLHYAYMLLPTGLVMGVLNLRMSEPVSFELKRWQFMTFFLGTVMLLATLTRDYFRVEESFYQLRFERARIGSPPTEPLASVILLDHMNAFVRLGRTPAKIGMTDQELDSMQMGAFAYPSMGNLFTLILAFAWNNRTLQAQHLVNALASLASPDEYIGMRAIWQRYSLSDAKLASVAWPE
jgi:O-antigen ligase